VSCSARVAARPTAAMCIRCAWAGLRAGCVASPRAAALRLAVPVTAGSVVRAERKAPDAVGLLRCAAG
jgi:hypothetical protein